MEASPLAQPHPEDEPSIFTAKTLPPRSTKRHLPFSNGSEAKKARVGCDVPDLLNQQLEVIHKSTLSHV
jgi:hypothetical protein